MEYRPLNASKQEIRLITILQASVVLDKIIDVASQRHSVSLDTVQCHLEHVCLEDPTLFRALKESPRSQLHPQVNWDDCSNSSAYGEAQKWRYTWGDYVALSYAWGNLTETREIILNGHRTSVGANLEDALRVLRSKRPIQAGYKIWIDALCINQRDIGERGREVKRMRQIYSQATDIIIWLGNKENDSDKALTLIRILSKSYETGQDRTLGAALRQQPRLLGPGSWRALSQLLDRPYWDRLWVLQEIALGGDRTPIFCGHQVVTWGDLYNATYLFGMHNFDIMFSLIDRERKDAGLPVAGLKRNKIIHLKEEQLVQAGQGKEHAMCMLDLARRSLATDAKDKIYGILGMMETSVADLITPDYASSLAEVFTSFAKAMIVANDNLEILEQCTWSTKCMPSWVPDWTNMDHYRLFSGRSTYRASRNSGATFHFHDGDQSLVCHGVKIDYVDGLGKSYYEYPKDHNPNDAIVQPIGTKNIYGSEDTFREALWRTLVGNRDLQGKKVPEEYRCLLECTPVEEEESMHNTRGARAFNRFISQSAGLQIGEHRLGSYFAPVTTTGAQELKNPQEKMFRFLRTRRLMVTLNGFIGLVPIETQQGDLVSLLLGSNVPVILRLFGTRYRIVGGCYVHGIMEGEVMESLEIGQNCIEEVYLR